MMSEPDDITEWSGEANDRLLECRLGECSPEQREKIQDDLAADERLAMVDERIGEYLALLDALDPQPPDDLEQKVLAHVRAADQAVAIDAQAGGDPDLDDAPRRSGFFSLRDLIAVAASIAIIVGLFIPIYIKAVDARNRNACQANLGRIGLGTAMYASDHSGALPFAGEIAAGSRWLADGPVAGPRASNTKHWFLLVKNGYVDAVAFICPASDGQPLPQDRVGQLDDFPSAKFVQYSFHSMAGARVPIDRIANMPIAADLNPYFRDGRFRLDLDWPRNASVHGDNAGQVVAKADGSANWYTTPSCGIGGDNIYQAGSLTTYFGTECPTAPTDTFAINF